MAPLLIIGIVTVIFIVAVKLDAPLGLTFIGIALLLGLLSGMPFVGVLMTIGKEVVAHGTLRLVGIVYILNLMGVVLTKMGVLTRTVESLSMIIKDRRVSMVVPAALIGLLPMPGGAMLSAPMVEEGSRKFQITPERLTFLNYWFRHLWEYVWPLYPGIILSTGLLNLRAAALIAPMWPLTIVSVFTGGIIGFRGLGKASKDISSSGSKIKALGDFFRLTWYVWVVVVFVLFFGFDILPIVALCGLLILLFAKFKQAEKLKFLKSAISWKVLTLVTGVMVFKGTLELTGILEELTTTLAFVPKVLLLFIIPFAVGLLTGVNAAYVGLGFPLLTGFFISSTGNFDAGNFAFAYAAGFAGVLVSPVHLCLALTKEYFGANWGGIYKFLIPAASIVFASAIIILIFL
jgi:integral membrane protein (TIGR00529 family)